MLIADLSKTDHLLSFLKRKIGYKKFFLIKTKSITFTISKTNQQNGKVTKQVMEWNGYR